MPSGGKREGAGRKTKAEEDTIKAAALSAIEGKYGSVTEGFKWLLSSMEPALIKFAWEHAVGKTKDRVDVTTNGKDIINPIVGMIIEK